MDTKSQESLFVQSLGRVTVRGLTLMEAGLLGQTAIKTAPGNQNAQKWLICVGSLAIGAVQPRLTRPGAELYMKAHARDAAMLITKILEMTTKQGS